ncbi:MAG: hypothetical protein AAF626_06020 [Pseudomonadota bacterium]
MASTKASDGEAKVRASDGEALIRASDGEAVRDASIDIAERQFLDALMAVEAITEKIKRQEIEALTEVPKAAAHAAAATKHLLTEKHRVYEQQKRHAGIVGDFAIDFDAARDEIGRRLARLRAARGD